MSSSSWMDRLGRSLLVLPTTTTTTYNQIRPHHLVVLYAVYSLFTSTQLYRNYLSNKFLSLLGHISEKCIPVVYTGLVPDFIIRWGIRWQLRDHLQQLETTATTTATATTATSSTTITPVEQQLHQKMEIVQQLRQMPIAVQTESANQQHYEVPAAFYDLCLGPRKKYSSGLWPTKTTTFEESEIHMLELYCQRAGVQDGMSIVDLGCGWGSLTLYLAEQYPNAKITGISNSHSQREYILKTAQERGFNVQNINIITCNVADDKGALKVVKNNDLVMTVEMFEHMKNYQSLLHKIHGFLKPGGKLFVHIFTHKNYTYHFDQGWMSENFFTGGIMPSDDLLLYFAQDFCVQQHWRVNGQHYEKTSNGWLAYLDASWKNGALKPVLAQAYGQGKEWEWYINWRLFFLACAELWGFDGGQEWIVSHYLFERR